MSLKLKYIRLKQLNIIVIFSELLNHSDFKNLGEIVSAGFCYFGEDSIVCYGESISLGLKSKENEDSILATQQFLNN